MKKYVLMPSVTAEQDPEAWANYWRDVKSIRVDVSPERRKQLNARRYLKVKMEREKMKLAQLMKRYPDEVTRLLGR